MIKTKEIKYGLKDISIVPAPISNIDSRNYCNPHTDNGTLPLFTAPMSSVVDLKNYQLFKNNKINPIIPRNIDFQIRKEMSSDTWCAFSLKEFNDMIAFDEFDDNKTHFILIDIANGSLKSLHDSIENGKASYGDKLQIMAGNVANPLTYVALSNAGCDYVRIGIGGGAGCLPSGTKIKLSNGGEKNIEDISVFDTVKTHIGNNNVCDTLTYLNRNNKIIEFNKELKCTDNHKLWVVNKDDFDKISDDNIEKYAYWLEANRINKNKHFLIKKLG